MLSAVEVARLERFELFDTLAKSRTRLMLLRMPVCALLMRLGILRSLKLFRRAACRGRLEPTDGKAALSLAAIAALSSALEAA